MGESTFGGMYFAQFGTQQESGAAATHLTLKAMTGVGA